MRAKKVFEKFVEDSDPITDMGIGLESIYENLQYGMIFKVKKTSQREWFPKAGEFILIMSNAVKVKREDGFNKMINAYIYKTKYDILNNNKKDSIYGWYWSLDFIKEFFTYVGKRANLNEKFTEDSDPIDDLGIGTRHKISKWMKGKGEEDTDNNALVACARHGKTEWVEYLINRGADVHTWDDFALRSASHNGHAEVVKLLLNAGANVHDGNDHALRWASYHGHAEVVKILLNAGADVHVGKDLALQWASYHGHAEVVKILQDHIKKNKIKNTKK